MNNNRQGGFTLLELIAVIILLGIALPFAVMPFTESVKSVSFSADMASLSSVAAGSMDRELARVDAVWPSVSSPSFAGETTVQTVGGKRFTATIKRRFVDAFFNTTDGDPSRNNNQYLYIELTVRDEGADAVSLSTVKARDY